MEHDEHDEDTDPELRLLAAALAEGRTHAEAGNLCGISAKTVQRRLRDPEFSRMVSALRTQRVEELTGRLIGLTNAAVDVFVAALDADEPQIRLHGGRAILDYAQRFHRQDGNRALAERMTAIEDKVGKANTPRSWFEPVETT